MKSTKTGLRLDIRTAIMALGNEATTEQIVSYLKKKVTTGVVNRALKASALEKKNPEIPLPYIRHMGGEGAKAKWKIVGQRRKKTH